MKKGNIVGKHYKIEVEKAKIKVVLGFEPRLSESESEVMPLHYTTLC